MLPIINNFDFSSCFKSDLKETTGKLWQKLGEDITNHDDRLTNLEDALLGRNQDSNEKFDQLQVLINNHGESVSQLANQVQSLTEEFRGVLQTVDDQVSALLTIHYRNVKNFSHATKQMICFHTYLVVLLFDLQLLYYRHIDPCLVLCTL